MFTFSETTDFSLRKPGKIEKISEKKQKLKHSENWSEGCQEIFDAHGFRESPPTRRPVRRDCDAIGGLDDQVINNAIYESLETDMTNQ
jgi:hypothetical protein